MAHAIEYSLPDNDLQALLYAQLRNAPEKHVDALLNAYAILQLLQDKGILELIKGALGSGEKVLGVVTETMENDDVIRGLRNLVTLLKFIGSVEPEAMESILKVVSEHLANSKDKEPPNLIRIAKKISSPESRRVMDTLSTAMHSMGHQIQQQRPKAAPRKKVTRHSA